MARRAKEACPFPWTPLPGDCCVQRTLKAELGVCKDGKTYRYQVARDGRVEASGTASTGKAAREAAWRAAEISYRPDPEPCARVSVRPKVYRDRPGYSVQGCGARVFAETRAAADALKSVFKTEGPRAGQDKVSAILLGPINARQKPSG